CRRRLSYELYRDLQGCGICLKRADRERHSTPPPGSARFDQNFSRIRKGSTMINKDSLTHHISQQFNAELEEVRSHLLAMGGLVEKQVNDGVTALIEADSGLARQVREIDDQINQMERNIDEECLRILARRQPAASDLRLIISISKSV